MQKFLQILLHFLWCYLLQTIETSNYSRFYAEGQHFNIGELFTYAVSRNYAPQALHFYTIISLYNNDNSNSNDNKNDNDNNNYTF